MIDLLTIIGSALIGAAAAYAYHIPRMKQLAKLTDRDERGRFKK